MRSSPIEFDRLPPQNLEAEMAVIGSVLLDSSALDETVDLVSPEDFYRDSHQIAWRAILEMRRDGWAIDIRLLVEHLELKGQLAKVGGIEAIGQMLEGTPSAANAQYYAQIVKQRSLARQVIEAANNTLRDAYSNNFTADELLDGFGQRYISLSRAQSVADIRSLDQLVSEFMTDFHAISENGLDIGVATGFDDIDSILGGLRSRLYVVGARPGHGKSALALNIADHVASETNEPVLFFSLEMDFKELTERIISARSGVDGKRLRLPMLATDHDRFRIGNAVRMIAGVPVWFDIRASIKMTQITAIARRYKAGSGLRLVVVDYLQLVSPDNRREPRQEQIASISRSLQALAKDLDVPVLALSQLNRESDKQKTRPPRLADLRESGQIEQDAHAVMLLYRPECNNPSNKPGIAELIVAKNRSGATGKIDMTFEKELTRFSSISYREPTF